MTCHSGYQSLRLPVSRVTSHSDFQSLWLPPSKWIDRSSRSNQGNQSYCSTIVNPFSVLDESSEPSQVTPIINMFSLWSFIND